MEADDLGDSELTAKTLSARAVFDDPQSGHFALASLLIVRMSCSNLASQDLQVYSYIGIRSLVAVLFAKNRGHFKFKTWE